MNESWMCFNDAYTAAGPNENKHTVHITWNIKNPSEQLHRMCNHVLNVTFQMCTPVLCVLLHLLYLLLLCFHPSTGLTSFRPSGTSPARPPGRPELPNESRKLQGQWQAPTGNRRGPEGPPDWWARSLIWTDPDIDPDTKTRVPQPDIWAPEPLQNWHRNTTQTDWWRTGARKGKLKITMG